MLDMTQNADNWRRKAESLSKAIHSLEATIASQIELLRFRNAQLEQAQRSADQTKDILRSTIADNANTVNELNQRITALMDKLKEFGFGDFDSLGK